MIEQGRISGLDGLRGVAVSLVIITHAAELTEFPVAAFPLLERIVGLGWTGVDLFFAISGFLITTLLMREERANELASGVLRFDLRAFYLRRALRILPPYLFVVVVLLSVVGTFDFVGCARAAHEIAGVSPSLFIFLATFTSNYGFALRVVPLGAGMAYVALWSLCVEEHFYAGWSLLLTFVKSARFRLICIVGVCVVSPLLRWQASVHEFPLLLKIETHLRLDAILCGAGVALAFPFVAKHVKARRALLIALLMTLLAFGRDMHAEETTRAGFAIGFSVLTSLCALVVGEAAASPQSPFCRILAIAPLRKLGEVSYGMYLLHIPLIDMVKGLLLRIPMANLGAHFVLSTICYIGLTYLAARLMFRFVERPFLIHKSRLSRGLN